MLRPITHNLLLRSGQRPVASAHGVPVHPACTAGWPRRQQRSGHCTGGSVLLNFAQWQGEGGNNAEGIVRGSSVVSKVLASLLPPAVPQFRVPVSFGGESGCHAARDSGAAQVHWHADLARQVAAACSVLDDAHPSRVFTAGGDCAVDLASGGWLLERFAGDVGILYIDAHADLNSPSESPSGNFHGMCLRALLGDDEFPADLQPRRAASPSSIIYAGVRELDASEGVAMQQLGIASLSSADLKATGGADMLSEWLCRIGVKQWHIHLDMDVLDPREFPHVSAASRDGISISQLRDLLHAVQRLPLSYVGLTVTEVRPLSEADERDSEAALRELLGPNGLSIASWGE